MPDPQDTSNPDLTPEQLKSLQNSMDELDREIARAKALDISPTSYQARLISVRTAISDLQQTNTTQNSSATKSAAQPADNSTAAPMAEGTASPQPQNKTSEKDSTDVTPTSTKQDSDSALKNSIQNASPSNVTDRVPDFSMPDSISVFPFPDANGPDDGALTSSMAGASSTLGLESVAAAQSQSIQQSASRLSAVLEQNTGLTNSLFSQMLELLDSQNKKLGDVDRKISDLSGQLKSLKNP